MRASWDQTWGRLALSMARRSRCDRANIGAVIVSPQNRVVATGYNGPPAQWTPEGVKDPDDISEHCTDWCPRAQGQLTWDDPRAKPIESVVQVAYGTDYSNCPANHAEINALMHSAREKREGGSIYVTGSICMTCAKAIANSGIWAVYLVNVDKEADAHRHPDEVIEFMRQCGLAVIELAVT